MNTWEPLHVTPSHLLILCLLCHETRRCNILRRYGLVFLKNNLYYNCSINWYSFFLSFYCVNTVLKQVSKTLSCGEQTMEKLRLSF